MSAKISFEQLFGDDKLQALSLFLLWVDRWLEGYESEAVSFVDKDAAFRFVSNLQKIDFPANGGFDAASPFKKAACLYVWLHNLNPFIGRFPHKDLDPDIAKFSNVTASLAGIAIVRDCLHGAELKKGEEVKIIDNPIHLSRHFLIDLVEASGTLIPQHHFQTFSLLFEALTYEANPGLSYEKIV